VSITVDALNEMSSGEAAENLQACCGSSRWVNEMVALRPFQSYNAIAKASDEVWASCTGNDWLEAFDHHPRIGGTRSAATQSGTAKAWSSGEQSGMKTATSEVQEDLAAVNAAYERKFGHIFIVCAAGRNADEMLDMAKARMTNDVATELQVAAEEQRKITQLRLKKLFGIEQ
jgi:OHCU decarboxylase